MSRRTVAALTAVVWTFVLAGALAIFFIFAQGSNPFTYFNPVKGDMRQLQQQTVNQEVTSISVEWVAGGIHVKKATDGKLQLVEKSEYDLDMKQWASVSVDNGRLTIKSRIRSVWNVFTFFTPSSYLELYLPEKIYDEFVMESTSGIYVLENLQVKTLDLQATSGNYEVQSTIAENMTVEVTSGKLVFNQVESKNVHLKMTSGDTWFEGVVRESWKTEMTSGRAVVHLKDVAPKHLTVEMTSGLTEVNLVNDADFTLVVEKTSGVFNANWPNANSSSPYKYQSGRDSYRLSMTSGIATFNIQP